MKSLAELERRKEKASEKMHQKDKNRITVGMATCGMAAGAGKVKKAMTDEIAARGITDMEIVMTGCIGACRLEPIVEVYDDGERTTYVNISPEKARRIITEHAVNNRICEDLVIDPGIRGK